MAGRTKYIVVVLLLLQVAGAFNLYACFRPDADFSIDSSSPVTSTTIFVGDTILFDDQSDNSPTSWQWSFSPNDVTYVNGTSSSSQNPYVRFDETGSYDVSLWARNSYGNDTETKTDYITVGELPEAGSIGTAQTICYGAIPAELTSTDDGGGAGTLSYEWQTNASGSFATISDATSADYQPPDLYATTSYRRRTVATYGGQTRYSDYTDAITITVYSEFSAGEIAETGETICSGTSPTEQIGSIEDAGGGDETITYQWQYSTVSDFSSDVTTISANTATYTPTQVLTQTSYYRRLAHDGSCSTSFVASDNIWQVTVGDNEAPSAECVSNITVYVNSDGEAQITSDMIDNGSTDNCGIESMWVSPSVLSCPDDDSGTSSSYSASIETTDGATVSITVFNFEIVPSSTSCDYGYNYDISFDYLIEYTGTNSLELWNRQLSLVVDDDTFDAQTTVSDGTVTSVITTNNQYRNESDCNTISFADVSLSSITWNVQAKNISRQTLTLQEDSGSASSQDVTLHVQDYYGNTGTCTTAVTVVDTISPTITCPADISQSVDEGLCTASDIDLGEPITADNCGVADVSNDAPSTYSMGNNTVTWTLTDNSGNTATCTQNVSIVPEEELDVEVIDLAPLCQSGQSGTTTITWEVELKAGSADWTYDYTINNGDTDVASATNVSASGNTSISYTINNSSLDQSYTLTLKNVTDNCGVADSGSSAKTDSVIVYAVPATGEIIPD